MKMMPWFSTRSSASFTVSSRSTSLRSSSSSSSRRASGIFTVRRLGFLGSMSMSQSVKLDSGASIPSGERMASGLG